jgi:diaminopimelate epimerase
MREKYNANVNFAYIKNKDLYVRTFERGVENETLACGTGMASVFYLAKEKNLIKDNKIFVFPTSKERIIFWSQNNDIFFQGEVKSIFSYDYLL